MSVVMHDLLSQRIDVTLGKQEKTLLNISEMRRGDVSIDLRSAALYTEFGKRSSEPSLDHFHGRTIKLQRYSIHPSRESTKHINVIKHSIHFDDRTIEEITRHHTKAIKQTNQFAPVYFRLFPSLQDARYNGTSSARSRFSVGSIPSTETYTLYIGLFVSSRSRFFEMYSNKFFRWQQFKTRLFNIVLLYSFIPIIPHSGGFLTHVCTLDEDENDLDRALNSEIGALGVDETGAVNYYYQTYERHRKSFLDVVRNHYTIDDDGLFEVIFALSSRDMMLSEPDGAEVAKRLRTNPFALTALSNVRGPARPRP